jgi:hypothetical protein
MQINQGIARLSARDRTARDEEQLIPRYWNISTRCRESGRSKARRRPGTFLSAPRLAQSILVTPNSVTGFIFSRRRRRVSSARLVSRLRCRRPIRRSKSIAKLPGCGNRPALGPSGMAASRGSRLGYRSRNEHGTDSGQDSLLHRCLHHELACRQGMGFGIQRA